MRKHDFNTTLHDTDTRITSIYLSEQFTLFLSMGQPLLDDRRPSSWRSPSFFLRVDCLPSSWGLIASSWRLIASFWRLIASSCRDKNSVLISVKIHTQSPLFDAFPLPLSNLATKRKAPLSLHNGRLFPNNGGLSLNNAGLLPRKGRLFYYRWQMTVFSWADKINVTSDKWQSDNKEFSIIEETVEWSYYYDNNIIYYIINLPFPIVC